MQFNRFIALSCVLGATAFGAVACGGDDEEEGTGGGGANTGAETAGGGGRTLTIYSSLPQQGAQRIQTQALQNGIRLALRQANNRAGEFQVRYEALDDSTAQAGSWTPERTSDNARRATRDENTAVYIGEFNSGASAISMPILNEAQIPQISPSNTAVGLTSDEAGADRGEPEKYYPTGERHYVRIVPKDTIQGAALATTMQQDGCQNVFMANDREVYGAGLARNVENSVRELGLNLIANEGVEGKASNFRSLAQRAASENADCFVFAGITSNGAAQIFQDFAQALGNDARLYGPDGVAESTFVDPDEGGIPAAVARRTKVTVATLNPDAYPPEGQEFFQQYEQQFNDANPDPYAIYGYEAARLALDAIERSGSGERPAIIEALFNTENRESVLGNYSIDDNGDTTLTTYGVYGIEDGELSFQDAIEAGGQEAQG